MTNRFDISELKKPKKQGILKTPIIKEPVKKPVLKKEKRAVGRPSKNTAEKLTKKITVNFTESEFNTLLKLSVERYDISLSKIIRLLLKENKHI
jgi:hypothetical protein